MTRSRKTQPQPSASWLEAGLDDPIETLELSARAHGALVRVGASRVRDLLNIEARTLAAEPNVGPKTWRQLDRLLRVLSDRFAVSDLPPENVPDHAGKSLPWSQLELDTPLVELEIPTRLA